jgi:hypothetical protein
MHRTLPAHRNANQDRFQLEQTVQRLQASLALSPEQTASLPSPQARLRELEHENEQLRLEIAELRRQVLCGPSSSIDMRPGTANGSRHSPRSSSSAEYNDSYDGRIANGLGNKRKRSSHDDPNFVPRVSRSPSAHIDINISCLLDTY